MQQKVPIGHIDIFKKKYFVVFLSFYQLQTGELVGMKRYVVAIYYVVDSLSGEKIPIAQFAKIQAAK